MTRPARPWLAAAVALGFAVGGVAVYRFWPKPPAPPSSDPSLRFADVTERSGITFRHVNGAAGKKLLPETMGSGVAVIDFDRDGRPDLFFVNGRPWPGQPGRATQALYRNRGDGTFEDVTAACGLDVELYGMGVAVGDFDNDGWPDLFVTAVGGNRLFRNVAGKRFEDVTARAGLGGSGLPAESYADFLKHAEPIPFPVVVHVPGLRRRRPARFVRLPLRHLVAGHRPGGEGDPARRGAGLRPAAAVRRVALRPVPERGRDAVRGRVGGGRGAGVRGGRAGPGAGGGRQGARGGRVRPGRGRVAGPGGGQRHGPQLLLPQRGGRQGRAAVRGGRPVLRAGVRGRPAPGRDGDRCGRGVAGLVRGRGGEFLQRTRSHCSIGPERARSGLRTRPRRSGWRRPAGSR